MVSKILKLSLLSLIISCSNDDNSNGFIHDNKPLHQTVEVVNTENNTYKIGNIYNYERKYNIKNTYGESKVIYMHNRIRIYFVNFSLNDDTYYDDIYDTINIEANKEKEIILSKGYYVQDVDSVSITTGKFEYSYK